MEQNEKAKKQLTNKEKISILFAMLAGFDVGGILGIIDYYQHWLG